MSAHLTYADTGEPVMVGDKAAGMFTQLLAAPLTGIVTGSFRLFGHECVGYPPYTSIFFAVPDVFYKHRHNAIAAWEALLEEKQ